VRRTHHGLPLVSGVTVQRTAARVSEDSAIRHTLQVRALLRTDASRTEGQPQGLPTREHSVNNAAHKVRTARGRVRAVQIVERCERLGVVGMHLSKGRTGGRESPAPSRSSQPWDVEDPRAAVAGARSSRRRRREREVQVVADRRSQARRPPAAGKMIPTSYKLSVCERYVYSGTLFSLCKHSLY
jgi:hypothetical protein